MVESIFAIPIMAELLSFLIPFLLIFVLLYATFTKTQQISERNNINATIAFVIAFIAAAASGKFLIAITPFFATFLVLMFSMFILLSFLGYKPEMLIQSKGFMVMMFFAGVLFVLSTSWFLYNQEITQTIESSTGFVGSFDNVPAVGENATESKTSGCDYGAPMNARTFWCTLMHPDILGAVVLLVLMTLITWFFTRNSDKPWF